MQLEFVKMNGLGNDFVVLDARQNKGLLDARQNKGLLDARHEAGMLDARDQAITLTANQARYIADRHFGIGCDQILIIAPSDVADITMHILNSDGSVAAACGNGSRCVADRVMVETNAQSLSMETLGGVITAARAGENIAIDMGTAWLDWQDIPLAYEADTAALDLGSALGIDDLPPAIAVNMGNPHAVHIVDDASAIDLAHLGPQLEHHSIFPDRANIEFISLLDKDTIRMRVWERGSGITIACGTGACASAVATARAGLTGRQVTVHLDGGVLDIHWRDDGGVTMTGPSSTSFQGVVDLTPADRLADTILALKGAS